MCLMPFSECFVDDAAYSIAAYMVSQSAGAVFPLTPGGSMKHPIS
jgi:hypothetical protein